MNDVHFGKEMFYNDNGQNQRRHPEVCDFKHTYWRHNSPLHNDKQHFFYAIIENF